MIDNWTLVPDATATFSLDFRQVVRWLSSTLQIFIVKIYRSGQVMRNFCLI